MPDLRLRRASGRRPSAQWPDDYDVIGAEGEVVGRIYKFIAAPAVTPWAWTVSDGNSGYGATREAVLRAFAKAWHEETRSRENANGSYRTTVTNVRHDTV
jgi:hypothetical protein